jgi:hypothetical protein
MQPWRRLRRPGSTRPSLAQDAPITASEADAIRQQIIPCWYIPMDIEHPERYRVVLEVTLAPDGRVTDATVKEDRSRLEEPDYKHVAHMALRAVKNPSANPCACRRGGTGRSSASSSTSKKPSMAATERRGGGNGHACRCVPRSAGTTRHQA